MTGVMFSIQPRHVENIFSGRKTVEVRLHAPALPTPYKAYIYETQGPTETPWMDEDGHLVFKGRGAVVGEVTVPKVQRHGAGFIPENGYLAEMCLTMQELVAYRKGKGIAGIRLRDVVIYDSPLPITAFKKACPNELYCESCAMFDAHDEICGNAARVLRKPPQSWCYVETLE
jgi:predicted transcriptional regulator